MISEERMLSRRSRACASRFMMTASVLAFYTLPAVAQETTPSGHAASASASAATEDDRSSEEIVVTGNKLGSEIARAPVSAVTFSEEALVEQRVLSTTDLTGTVPSLNTSNPAGFAQTYIRGIGSNFANAGVESSVATYVDGVYLQRQNGASIDLVDVRNITVLNGPQGTLYGRNATGGVVLVETADPVSQVEAFARVEYGSYDQFRLQGVVNLPISETLAVRIAAQHRSNNGYLTDVNTGDKVGDSHSNYVRVKARWAPSSEFSAVYGFEYYKSSGASLQEKQLASAPYCIVCALDPTLPTAAGRGFYVVTGEQGYNRVRFTAHTLTLNYTADNFTVNSITGYRQQKAPTQNELDGMGLDFFHSNAVERGPTFTNDTYLRTTFDSPLNGLIGASFLRDRDRQQFSFTGLALGGLVGINRNHVKIDSASVYGELTYAFDMGLKLTAGARFNHDRKALAVTNNDAAILGLGLVGVSGADAFSRKATFDSVTPRAVISYSSGPTYIYASYNRGEKSGGFGSPLSDPRVAAADSEVLDSFEVGLKSKFLDGRLRTSLAGYYGFYKNIQVQTVDPRTGSLSLENAAKGKLKGVEFTGDLDVTDRFNLNAGVSYMRNRFTSYPDAAVFSPGGTPDCPTAALGLSQCRADLSHSPLTRSPALSGSVSGRYTQPLPDGWSIEAYSVARFTSKFLFSPGAGGPLQLDRQPGYTTVDVSLTLTTPDEKTEFGAFVQNLFEKHYYTLIATGSFGTYAVPSMPRVFGVRASHSF